MRGEGETEGFGPECLQTFKCLEVGLLEGDWVITTGIVDLLLGCGGLVLRGGSLSITWGGISLPRSSPFILHVLAIMM